jgi:stringent starvation protein B
MMPPMNVGPTATKKNVLEQLLDQGMVLVALDARVDGVEVPSHLGRDAQLRLNLSYRFGLPMTVDEWGILATLTFAGVPFNCRFPWRSVFLLVSHVSGQPYLFPDDIPPELLSQATAEAGIDAKIFTSASAQPAASPRPKLRLVTSEQTASTDETQPGDEDIDDAVDDADEADDRAQAHTDEANKPHEPKEQAPKRQLTPGRTAKSLRFAKADRPDDDAGDSRESKDADAPDAAPAGPRVAPALKRRSSRGSRSSTAAQVPDAGDARGDSASTPQSVSQPGRVSLSSSSTPDAVDDATDAKKAADPTVKPDDPPPAGRPRKGGHLRVVK